MTKQATQQKEIQSKSDAELQTIIQENREKLRIERFKDRHSRAAATVRHAKRQIARAMTELTARRKSKQN
jgi:ribosomal protein L29